MGVTRWSRTLVVAGLIVMVIGAIDPLEGSLVILPGTAMVALGAWLGKSRYWKLLCWAFVLVAVGVAALFAVSAVGGFGGRSSLSYWWGILILPFPIGWVLGIIGAIKKLREGATPSAPSNTP